MPDNPEGPTNPSRREFLKKALKVGAIVAGATALGLGVKELAKPGNGEQKSGEPANQETVKKLADEFDKLFVDLSGNKSPNWKEKAWETYSFVSGANHFYLTRINDGRKLIQIVENPVDKKAINQYRITRELNAIEKLKESDIPAPPHAVTPTPKGQPERVPTPPPLFHDAIEGVLTDSGADVLVKNLSSSFEKRSKTENGGTIPSSYPAPTR